MNAKDPCFRILNGTDRFLPAEPPADTSEEAFFRLSLETEAKIKALPEAAFLEQLQHWLQDIHREESPGSSRKGFLPGTSPQTTLKTVAELRGNPSLVRNVVNTMTAATSPELSSATFAPSRWLSWRDYCVGRFLFERLLREHDNERK